MNNYNDLINNYLTPNPKDVEGLNNSTYFFWENQLFQKVMSLFEFKNLPENWSKQYLLEHLLRDGVVCVTDFGGVTYPLQTGIAGFNVYNEPTECVIANPVLGSFTRQIGIDCEVLYVLRLNDQYFTFNELVKRYAVLLAQCDGSLNQTLMNSRVAHVFEANTKAELKTLQKIYDDVSNGKPAVFLNKAKDGGFEHNNAFINVKNTFIGTELLDTKRTIMNEFLTEIGIDNANTDKKERLITDEVNANKQEIKTNVSIWIEQLKKCVDKVNNMFNLNIEVDIRKVEEDEPNQRMAMDETTTI